MKTKKLLMMQLMLTNKSLFSVTLKIVYFFQQDIKFPLSLDVYDLCTPELQKRLTPTREAFKIEEDKAVERKIEACFYNLFQFIANYFD